MNLKAVIFDLDGTVLSNEDEWGEAFNIVLKKLGVETNSTYPHIGGIGIEENWPIFIKKYNIKTAKSISELAQETIREYYKLIPKVTLKNGIIEFIEELRAQGIKTALATSSSWEIVQSVFDQLRIEKYFDSVTTGEEAHYKKPNPQIFEIAAEKLGVNPKECLVVEDSPAGIKAAHSARIKVIGIYRNPKQKDQLLDADVLFSDFKNIPLNKLNSIV